MRAKTLTALLLLSLSAQAAWTAGADTGIDPKPLTWWSDSWTARPIEVSRSNASSDEVTLTFKVRTSTSLPVGGVFEVYFPTSFAPPSGNINNSQVITLTSAVTAGTEYSLQVTGVTMPALSAAYGPFKILTRPTPGGQIYDMNNSFASVFIQSAIETTGDLTIIPNDYRSGVPVLNTVTLRFKFNVDINIWPHDTIVLYVPEKWSIPSSLESCNSVDVSAHENYFKTVSLDENAEHQLQCTPSASDHAIYIYGISEEIDISEAGEEDDKLPMYLDISGLTAPQADWNATKYSWTLEFLQWGTRHVKRQYAGTGPTTCPSKITVNSWVPSNGYDVDQIVQGLTLFTDISFKLTNPINQYGKIELSFQNVDVNTTNWKRDKDGTAVSSGYCYLQWQGAAIGCTASSGKLTLTLDNAPVTAATTFVVSALVNFNSASPMVSVRSYWRDGTDYIEVDRSALYPITYQSQNLLKANEYILLFNESNTVNTITTGSATNKYLTAFVELRTSVFPPSTTADIQVHLPTNNSGLQDYSVFLLTSGTNPLKVRYDLVNSTAGSITQDASALATVINASTQTDQISISNLNIASQLGGSFGFFNDSTNGSTPSTMTLPAVASNLATKYESWIVATVGNMKYVDFFVLSFAESEFTGFLINRGCGNLLNIQFQAPFAVQTDQDESRSYYLDYAFASGFTNHLGTQLSQGNDFPNYIKSGFQGVDVVYAADRTVRITGQALYTNDGTPVYDIWFAVEDPNAGTEQVTVTLYFTDSSDPNTKQQLMQQANQTVPNSIALNDASKAGFTAQSKKVNQDLDNVVFDGQNITTVANDKIHNIQLLQGFQFKVDGSIALDNGTISSYGKIESTNPLFAYPNIVGFSSNQCGGGTCNLTATGGIASGFIQAGAKVSGGHSDTSTVNDVCFTSQNTIAVTEGAITISSIEPSNTVDGRGPTSYHKEMTLTFSTENGIPDGGKIVLLMDSDWEPTLSTCKVQGLTNKSDTEPIQCTGNENTFTVSQFAGFSGSKTIIIQFEKVMPPPNTNTNANDNLPTSNLFNQVITYASVNGADKKIDEINSIVNEVSVNPQAEPGVTTIQSIRTIPPNASEASVDLYIRFQLAHSVPSGTVISVDSATGSWSLPTSGLRDLVYFNKRYSLVTATTTTIDITIAEDITQDNTLELYVESALTNPATTSTNAFLIKTTYRNVIFDQDTSENATEKHKLPVSDAIDAGITEDDNEGAIILNNQTAGEHSNYIFNFSSKENIVAGDQIWIKFPKSYDPFVGKAYNWYKWGEPTTYYLECQSSIESSTTECSVDRWTIRVKNIQETSADTNISVTIVDVKNPQATTQTANFEIFHMRGNMAVAANRAIDGIEILGQVSNITVKQVDVSDKNAYATGNYTFQLYLPAATALNSDHCIMVELPRQYNTNLTRNGTDIDCTLHTQNLANTSTDLSEVLVDGVSSCTTNDNMITMCLPANYSATFESTTRLYFRISNLANPQWGVERPQTGSFVWNFDANDFNVFTQYDIWTNQYDILVYDTALDKLVARSYQNVNNAYSGFQLKSRGFQVNEFDARNKTGQITVIPGLQTGNIKISTIQGDDEPLAADRVIFVPSINEFTQDEQKITFSSEDNFTMYHLEHEISFKLAAAIDINQGIYYIDWIQDEVSLDGSANDLYNPPTKTLLEVYPKYKATIKIETIRDIGVGKTSRPIKVTASNAPHTDISIDIKLSNSDATGITIQPHKLLITRGMTERYFLITIDAGFDVENSSYQTLEFTISGTDSTAFDSIGTVSFNVSSNPQNNPAAIVECTHSSVTQTSAETYATANADGIIYWAVAPYGTDINEDNNDALGNNIVTILGDYFKTGSSTVLVDDSEEEEMEIKPSEEDLKNTRINSWTAFERRVYSNYLQTTTYLGASVSTIGVSHKLAELDSLMAETTYNYWCFVKNESEKLSEGVTDSFTTEDLSNAVTFTISFGGTVSANMTEPLSELWTRIMGVQQARATNAQRVVTGGQDGTITTTTFTWVLPPIRRLQKPSPEEEVDISSDQEEQLRNDILNLGIRYTATFNSQEITRSSYTTPSWVTGESPRLYKNPTTSTITAEMQCNTTGEICGMCTRGTSDNDVIANQVLLGLDEDNKIADGSQCVNYENTSLSQIISIEGLQSSTSYICYFVCFNEYPTWPTPNEDVITSIIRASTIGVQATEEDSAEILKGIIGLILLSVFQ